ncbi:MAG: lipoprotein-releasing ABC transporter permease subunit [Steroidobacteraceae bacterium]
MAYEWLIGTRYMRSTHRRGFVSFVALMSVLGLMLGVAVLIVVLSVMNGFEGELRQRILSVTSHATLMGLEGSLPQWESARRRALASTGVEAAVPYVEAQAMLAMGGRVLGATVRGIDVAAERATLGLLGRFQSGSADSLVAGDYAIALGDALAKELNASVGDSLVVITPQGTATPGGIMPRMRRFRVSGIFSSGMYEFDRGLALVNIDDARRLYNMGDSVTGIRLTLDDPLQAPGTVRQLALELGGGYFVSDWTRNHANFFRSIQLTKSLMFFILMLIVAVAAFNIIATLVMIVKEKRGDVAILRSMGAAPRNILLTFTVQGVLIGVLGTLFGVLLGATIAHNLERLVHSVERAFGVRFLDPKVYFMSDLPAYVQWPDVLQVSAIALLLCAVGTLYPAWTASRAQPAEALRHD